jgi:pyrophosphatase PpaX
MRFSTVLFDLDGTLIDSGGMILASLRHATQTVLRREIPDHVLLEPVGGSGLPDQMRAIDPDRADELVAVYREHNEGLHRDLVACEGIVPVIEELHRQGRRLGVVTAKRHATVELAAPALPLLREFDVVVAWEDTERHKPHPDPILHALDRLDSEPSQAAYVGDSPFDLQAARAAGVFGIAATWGRIHAHERLAEAQPDAIVSKPDELLAIL